MSSNSLGHEVSLSHTPKPKTSQKKSKNCTFVLSLTLPAFQWLDWYPSFHFGDVHLDHVKQWQVFHQKNEHIKTKLTCSISKWDSIKISSLLISVTLPALFTFLTFLELIFQFWNQNFDKTGEFYEEIPIFLRSVSSKLSFSL